VLGGPKRVAPRVINVDQNAAYIGAVRELKAAGLLPDYCERRPVKYLNNIVEQDHRFIKRRVKPGRRVWILPDGLAHHSRLRSDAYDQKGTNRRR
jgi:transposase-like protein